MRKILILGISLLILTGCEEIGSSNDVSNTLDVGSKLSENQPTPTDIDYSLERYNLIKRAYWVNGMRDKAINKLGIYADKMIDNGNAYAICVDLLHLLKEVE